MFFLQESELLAMLPKFEIGPTEVDLLRAAASKIIEASATIRATLGGRSLVSAPIGLAIFIADALSYTHNLFPAGCNTRTSQPNKARRRPTDDDFALAAALEALGAHTPFTELEFPMYCEAMRRQKGDLALLLLTRHKDSTEKLALILDRLLDPVMHRMYRHHQSNAAYFLERDPTCVAHTPKNQRPVYYLNRVKQIEEETETSESHPTSSLEGQEHAPVPSSTVAVGGGGPIIHR